MHVTIDHNRMTIAAGRVSDAFIAKLAMGETENPEFAAEASK